MKLNSPTPVIQIEDKILEHAGIKLSIKREDLLHPVVSGNKWRKLKYNLAKAKKDNQKCLLTFGGAFSNHIVAVAFAAKEFGFNSIGVVRGEHVKGGNPTLNEASSYGMRLHFVSRRDYAEKDTPDFMERMREKFGEFYCVPEGGANNAGVEGVMELVKELSGYSHIVVPVGTGATLAGIINGMEESQSALGFAVLKGEGYLEENVRGFLKNASKSWCINHDHHFGGYAKFNQELVDFVNHFNKKFEIPLDPIYTGKMMYGLFYLASHEYFPKGSNIIAIHTGGLQGIAGFNERFGNLIESDQK